jgi:hypothetical protein
VKSPPRLRAGSHPNHRSIAEGPDELFDELAMPRWQIGTATSGARYVAKGSRCKPMPCTHIDSAKHPVVTVAIADGVSRSAEQANPPFNLKINCWAILAVAMGYSGIEMSRFSRSHGATRKCCLAAM